MINTHLNVLFSSDDNYAQHLGAAMYSLLENNADFDQVQVFIVDNDIRPDSKEKLETVAAQFSNACIQWIAFSEWKKRLNLDMAWDISLSSYARLFVADMLPETVDRVVYLDCDMIVCRSLRELWETNLDGCVLGAVQDFISDRMKTAVGVTPTQAYFNAGMLLIDLAAWRAQSIEQECLQFIEDHKGKVIHHDQGVINGVLGRTIRRLPLQYNVMTIHYIFDRRKLCKYFDDHAEFYSVTEVEEAKLEPTILHYTPSFTSRPWVRNCKHPLKNLYWQMVGKTSWGGAKPEKDRAKWYVRLINWRFRKLPY